MWERIASKDRWMLDGSEELEWMEHEQRSLEKGGSKR